MESDKNGFTGLVLDKAMLTPDNGAIIISTHCHTAWQYVLKPWLEFYSLIGLSFSRPFLFLHPEYLNQAPFQSSSTFSWTFQRLWLRIWGSLLPTLSTSWDIHFNAFQITRGVLFILLPVLMAIFSFSLVMFIFFWEDRCKESIKEFSLLISLFSCAADP